MILLFDALINFILVLIGTPTDAIKSKKDFNRVIKLRRFCSYTMIISIAVIIFSPAIIRAFSPSYEMEMRISASIIIPTIIILLLSFITTASCWYRIIKYRKMKRQ